MASSPRRVPTVYSTDRGTQYAAVLDRHRYLGTVHHENDVWALPHKESHSGAACLICCRCRSDQGEHPRWVVQDRSDVGEEARALCAVHEPVVE